MTPICVSGLGNDLLPITKELELLEQHLLEIELKHKSYFWEKAFEYVVCKTTSLNV